MQNKILIKLFVPKYDRVFDLFIPINEQVWKISKLAIKCIGDINGVQENIRNDFILVNQKTNDVYKQNVIIRETNIRNSSELVLLEKNKV